MTTRRSFAAIVTLFVAVVALLLPALSVPATAATTGGVKGVISSDGKLLPGLKVELTRADYDSDHYDTIASRTTNDVGAYSFSGFEAERPMGRPLPLPHQGQRPRQQVRHDGPRLHDGARQGRDA